MKIIFKRLILPGLLLMAGCRAGMNGRESKKEANSLPTQEVYTCPMHHEVRSATPGKCPLCGMTLVPVGAAPKTGDSTGALHLSAREQLLAGIRTDTVRRAPLVTKRILTGTTLVDPKGLRVVSAEASGWIVKMYVRTPGDQVKTGQKLYDLYSPEVLSTEKDYWLSLKQRELFPKTSAGLPATIRALAGRLRRWGLSGARIAVLGDSSDLPGRLTVYSSSEGVLAGKSKHEGDYVEQGDPVLQLAPLNTRWVEAQLFDAPRSFLPAHPSITVTLDGFPDKKFSGAIVFDPPGVQRDSREYPLYIAISPPDVSVQPGMLAYISMKATGRPVLAVPRSSVVYEGRKSYVWMAEAGDRFSRKEVSLGKGGTDLVEVLKGVKAGERVVCSGVYLLNSEYILRKGSGVNLSGMQPSDMQLSGQAY